MIDLREIDAKIAEKVFGVNLAAFGIFSKEGMRLRDRDFETREEAQRYIDSEDERQQEIHKAAAKGVNIQRCQRQVAYYSTDPADSKKVREKLAEKWDWSLDFDKDDAEPFTFLLRQRGETESSFVAVANTEELAVALCALKAYDGLQGRKG